MTDTARLYSAPPVEAEEVVPDWYAENIEEPVRPLVRYLRDNGINTQSSCGHLMWVNCEFSDVHGMMYIRDLMLAAGYTDYTLTLEWQVRFGGFTVGEIRIQLKPTKEADGSMGKTGLMPLLEH